MFNEAVITTDGLALDAKIRAGLTVAKFTHVKLGDGVYNGTEDLNAVTGMKNIRQEFGISSIKIIDNKTVRLRIISNNEGISIGYYISELGVFAEDPDKGEILYSIATGVEEKMDYQPSETELYNATSTFDTYTSSSNVSTATIEIGLGAAASAEDLEEVITPEYDDSGTVTEITSFTTFLSTLVSGMNFFDFFRNLKAGLQFVLHVGQLTSQYENSTSKIPTASLVYALKQSLDTTNSNLNDLNAFVASCCKNIITQDIHFESSQTATATITSGVDHVIAVVESGVAIGVLSCTCTDKTSGHFYIVLNQAYTGTLRIAFYIFK